MSRGLEPLAPHVPNIGPRGRRRRLLGGVGAFVVAGLIAVPLAGMSFGFRALLFFPLLSGAHGVFQARAKT